MIDDVEYDDDNGDDDYDEYDVEYDDDDNDDNHNCDDNHEEEHFLTFFWK